MNSTPIACKFWSIRGSCMHYPLTHFLAPPGSPLVDERVPSARVMWFDHWHAVKETDLDTTHIERTVTTTRPTTRPRLKRLARAQQTDIPTWSKELYAQRRETRHSNRIERVVGWAFCPTASITGRGNNTDHNRPRQRIETVRIRY